MIVVYYFDKKLNHCPVKEYLNHFNENNSKDKKILADINARIKFVLQKEGIPTPPICKSLKNYHYFEIRSRKNKNTLIRIFYFRNREKIVLLSCLEKPDNYDSAKEDRKILKQLDKTQFYQNNFINDNTLYEEYNWPE